MNRKILFIALLLAFVPASFAQKVSNASYEVAGQTIKIYYDLSSKAIISVYLSTDGGRSYAAEPLRQVRGDVGTVEAGTRRCVVWDVLKERENLIGDSIRFKVHADPIMYIWVDLGLPSGLLWADRNVGAQTPTDYGDYYAWGETQPKSSYDWDNYKYGTSEINLTKYCNKSSYGRNGFTDNLTTLQPSDDAATANIGSGARTPTKAEWEELFGYTRVEWTTVNGVRGRKFTGRNGKSIFLPAAGCYFGSSHSGAGNYGRYWSSSLYTDYPDSARGFGFYSSGQGLYRYYRYCGLSVRAVRSPGQD